MNKKDAFMAKHGTIDQINKIMDAHAPNVASASMNRESFVAIKAVASNPVLTHEHHRKLLDLEQHAVDYKLAQHQHHMHPDLVTEIARKNGTYVAAAVYHHPNVTSQALDHVITDAQLGPDDKPSKVIQSWIDKRDQLKKAGK